MHLTVSHPYRVAGLILMETLGAVPDGGSAELVENLVARLTPDERANLDELMAQQAAGDDDGALMTKIYMALWPSYSYKHGNVLPPVSMRLERPLDDGGPDTLASIRTHFEAGTLERGLPNLRVPALLIHGEGDPLPLHATEQTAALIPDAQVRIVDRAGHFPWIERANEVRSIIEGFLTEQGATPAS
jgi:proline iminopeptidase